MPSGLSFCSSCGEHGLREVLEADGTGEAVNGEAANGGEAGVGCGWIGAAMDHRVGHFYAGGKSVEEQAAGFLFEDGDEFAIGGEVVVIAEDGGGEVAVEGARGAQIVMRGIAIDKQCVGAKDFVGEFGLADELIEADRESLDPRGMALRALEPWSRCCDCAVSGTCCGRDSEAR